MLSLAPVCSWTLVSESQMSSRVAAIVRQHCQSHTDFPSKVYGACTDHVLGFHLPVNKPKEDRFCVGLVPVAGYIIEAQHMGSGLMGLCRVLTPQACVHISVISHQPRVVNVTSAISAEKRRRSPRSHLT